jgi:hypothetical protein
VVWQ